MTGNSSSRASAVLGVGDPRRRTVARGVVVTLLTSLAFFLFTAPTKQIASVYDHAPRG